MRYSVDEKDSGWKNWYGLRADCKELRIYLNNVEVHGVHTVDTERGIIHRARRDKNDKLMVDDDGEVLMETIVGNVRVEIVNE